MPLVAVNCHYPNLGLRWTPNQFDSEWKVYNLGYELGGKIYVSVRSSVLNEPHGGGYSAPEFTNIMPSYVLDGIRADHYVAYHSLRGQPTMIR